jgi:hypothetical protein
MKYYSRTFPSNNVFVDSFTDIEYIINEIRKNNDSNISNKSVFHLPNGHPIEIKNMHKLCAYKELKCAICDVVPNVAVETFDTANQVYIIRFAIKSKKRKSVNQQ